MVWNKVKEYSLPILLFAGIIILTTYFAYKYAAPSAFNDHLNGFKELFAIGLAILSSGIFLAVLKWFQFMGFFREELQKIISSSEFDQKLERIVYDTLYSDTFLKKQKDLPKLWRRVNRALFQNEFPEELAEQIESKMQDLFFHNRKLSHYYKNYDCTLNVKLEGDYLTINTITDTKIVRQDESPFSYDFEYFVEKVNNSDDKSAVIFNQIKINKTDEDLSKIQDIKGNETEIIRKFTIEKEGKKEYDLLLNLTLVQNIHKDFKYELYCERFIDYLRVQINYSNNLNVIFLPIGNEEFEDGNNTNSSFEKVYRKLLLPEKGFKLIFVKR